MASSKEYMEYVLEQLRDIDEISYRPMMSEYIIYCNDRVIGGVFDDRFLVKNTPSAAKLLAGAPLELPYEGAREMRLADIDDRQLLNRLIPLIAAEVPAKKKRNKTG